MTCAVHRSTILAGMLALLLPGATVAQTGPAASPLALPALAAAEETHTPRAADAAAVAAASSDETQAALDLLDAATTEPDPVHYVKPNLPVFGGETRETVRKEAEEKAPEPASPGENPRLRFLREARRWSQWTAASDAPTTSVWKLALEKPWRDLEAHKAVVASVNIPEERPPQPTPAPLATPQPEELPPPCANLNTASVEELMYYAGIDERRARAILDFRRCHGFFRSVDDLTQVFGVTDALVDQWRPRVFVDESVAR